MRSRHALDAGAPDGLVLLDLPDFDSVEAAHRAEVDRLVQMVDLLVWVVDPQKYADAALHERYLRPLAGHAAAMLVVLNQVDLLGGGTAAARDDLRGLLRGADLGEVPVLAVSARTGEGTDALRRMIDERVRSRAAALARLAADVTASARAPERADRHGPCGRDRPSRPPAARAPRWPRRRGRRRLSRRSTRRTGTGARWPPACPGWPGCAACDRIRSAGSASVRTAREDARTSLPRPTPVQRAQVDSAIRSLAGDAAAGLPEPWPTLARRAALSHAPELSDRLDRAIAGADLRLRAPRWWAPVRWLQRLLAAAALAGALWLVVLAGFGYLQLGDAVPTPELLGVAVPTLLLAGGLAAGLLLAVLARLVNRLGGRRRAARARRALDARVLAVADELVIAPLDGGAPGARHAGRRCCTQRSVDVPGRLYTTGPALP